MLKKLNKLKQPARKLAIKHTAVIHHTMTVGNAVNLGSVIFDTRYLICASGALLIILSVIYVWLELD